MRDDRLVWIDCEMTGLDLTRDALVEVAVLITEPDLTLVDEGIDVLIATPGEVLDSMVPFVAEMHAKSGLTKAVRAATTTLAEAQTLVLDYVRTHVPTPKTAPLCGNSIATDRGFLARDMPALDEHLHYRMIDVSSVKELAKRWYPVVYQAQPAKGLRHRALADIHDSVAELDYYRRTLFASLPGPARPDAEQAAADVIRERGSG